MFALCHCCSTRGSPHLLVQHPRTREHCSACPATASPDTASGNPGRHLGWDTRGTADLGESGRSRWSVGGPPQGGRSGSPFRCRCPQSRGDRHHPSPRGGDARMVRRGGDPAKHAATSSPMAQPHTSSNGPCSGDRGCNSGRNSGWSWGLETWRMVVQRATPWFGGHGKGFQQLTSGTCASTRPQPRSGNRCDVWQQPSTTPHTRPAHAWRAMRAASTGDAPLPRGTDRRSSALRPCNEQYWGAGGVQPKQ